MLHLPWAPVLSTRLLCDLIHSPLTVANWLPPYVCWHFLASDRHIKVVYFAFSLICYVKIVSPPTVGVNELTEGPLLLKPQFSPLIPA